MKSICIFLMFAWVTVNISCNSKADKTEINSPNAEQLKKEITFADFKKIKGVDNILEVPFQLFTKLDTVQFFCETKQRCGKFKICIRKTR